MKKLFLSLLLCVFAIVCVQAQESTFLKNDNVVNAGIGFGGNLYGWTAVGGISKLPTFSVSYERCIMDNLFDEKSSLGVGGLFAYTSAKWKGSGYGWKSSNMVIGVRGTFHYALVNKLDTYGGMLMGYNIYSHKWNGNYEGLGHKSGSSGFAWNFFVGARYYFTDAIAAYSELGFGYSIFNLGISFKF
jgi:hypothetical protein